MAKYHGKKGQILISTTGTGTAVLAANLNAWNVNSSTEKVDVTSFSNLNKQKVQGLPDVTGTLAGFFDDVTTKALYDGSRSADGVKMYIYPSSDAAGRYFYGTAFTDISFAGSVNGAVTKSMNFDASGDWGFVLG